ncbi:MAG: hypothetical protein ACM3NT_01650 [Methylocystaceae bacterium]
MPLSLAVLEETFGAWADLVRPFSSLIRLPRGLRINDLFAATGALFSGIRKHPNFNLVKVETDEVGIRVDLY